jgi:hypothetical protein
MRTLAVIGLSATLATGAALSSGSAVAQQKSLKEQLVGAWTLVSQELTAPDGTKRQPLGANPQGLYILDASGRFSEVAGRRDRPKYKTPGQPTTEERSAAAQDFRADFGTWSVNEADKTLTEHWEGALGPNAEGMDFKNSVSLAGDELKETFVNSDNGNITVFVYRRAR